MDNRAIWAGRVAEWRSSGLTSTEYCEGKPFTAGGLRHWAYRLRQVEPAKPAALAVRIARVVSTPAPIARFEQPRPSEALFVEVGALRVAVRPGFDRATLAAVLDVLVARGART
jgi:hypothetical protein